MWYPQLPFLLSKGDWTDIGIKSWQLN